MNTPADPPPEPPEPVPPKESLGARLGQWTQILSNVVVILGAAFAVWQVLELRADRRRDNAMQFVMLMHQEPYAGVALNLSLALQDAAAPEDPRLSPVNVQRLGDFYLSALQCRERGVCDRATIDAHFRGTIEGFYRQTFDRELVDLSCRLGQAANEYGGLLRQYLEATKISGAPDLPATRRRCP